MGLLTITGGMLLSRGIAKGLQSISNALFPYSKSREAERVSHTAQLNVELEKMRQKGRLKELGIQAEMQESQQMTIRETNMLVSQFTSYNHIKEDLYRDAIKRFPLNISPLSLLDNNNVNIDFFVKGIQKKNLSPDQFDAFRNYLHSGTRPLNIFVTPITIDSRVAGKETIAAQVWDSVYQSLESLFINEYNSNSDHPVNLFSTAWNSNAKPGLHAAEELYFFLKYIPSIVIEPRFDGKRLRIVFSCWSIGYNLEQRVRQELSIELDWLPMIIESAYTRSKKALALLSALEVQSDPLLAKKKEFCEHNVKLYENLGIGKKLKEGNLEELNVLGDYSRWFAVDSNDWEIVSQKISNSIGMVMAAVSDTHHLLASDVEPILPRIYDSYFPEMLDKEMAQNLLDMYESAYLRLLMIEPNNNDKKQLKELQLDNLASRLKLQAPKSLGLNPMGILIERCLTRWNYKAKSIEDAFNYYANHFTKEDKEFNDQLMCHLSKDQKRTIQRRSMTINNGK